MNPLLTEWGNITWMFFHVLAEQLYENKFSEVRELVINIILNTCKNLPCPTCSEHATDIILKRAYLENIKTKNHFVEFLRQFHNIVNIKLNKETFTIDEVKNKYKNINLVMVVNKFVQIHMKSSSNPRLITYNMHKRQVIKSIVADLGTIKNIMDK